jgi:uncharacterized protein (DUF1330 family)
MKIRFGMAVSMLAGAALGGAAIQALHAQAKPPVYMIAINEVSDPNGYAKDYVPPAQKSVKDRGGEYVAAGPGMQVTGNLPNGPVVIIRWDRSARRLAQFSRISGCTQDRREICEIQHPRRQWRETVARSMDERSEIRDVSSIAECCGHPPQRGLRDRGRGTGSLKTCPNVWA